jgi:hypothetical protein
VAIAKRSKGTAGVGQMALLEVEPAAAQRGPRLVDEPPTASAFEAAADVDGALTGEFAAAMGEQPNFWVNPESDFANATFGSSFFRLAVLYHVFNHYSLSKKVFENLLARAIRHGGRPVWEPESETHPFDLMLQDSMERLSLKTETGKNIKRGEITISKLIELSDERMPRTPAAAAQFAREDIPVILEQNERMILMRAFQCLDTQGRRCLEYVVLEVPKALFSALGQADEDEIEQSGQTLTLSLRVEGDPEPVMKLKFDGSVRKVTVRNLRTDYCTVHASFIVPYGDEMIPALAA